MAGRKGEECLWHSSEYTASPSPGVSEIIDCQSGYFCLIKSGFRTSKIGKKDLIFIIKPAIRNNRDFRCVSGMAVSM